jgi:hypothetical protein
LTSFPETLALAEPGREQVLSVEDWAEIRRLWDGDADIESAEPKGAPAAWDAGKLTKLATTKLSSTETVTRVLDILCEEPGRQHDMQDLVKALPMEYYKLRGNLAAFTRHLNKHYESDAWPMHVQWRGDEALYSVDPVTAARWKSVRS